MAKKDPSVADAVKAFADLPAKEVPAGVKKLAKLSPKDLKAESYTVTRVTAGGDISHQMDGKPGLFIPGVKDPHDEDPTSPAYMTDAERELYPDGIKWSAVLDKHTVVSLLEDPGIARHFTYEPVE